VTACEAAAALGEEARHTRRSVPASIVAIVIISGVFYLLVACAEMFAVGRHGVGGFDAQPTCLSRPRPSWCSCSRCGESTVRPPTPW
jgi:amino acid transporter